MADDLYQLGEPVPLHAEFRNAAGVLTNTGVTLEVRKPDGSISTPTPTNTSTGIYDYTYTATDLPGLYWYSFIGSGAVSATEQNSFLVEARFSQTGGYPLAANALVTIEDVREYVFGSALDDSQDHKIIRRINAVSTVIAGYTNRLWLPVAASTRKFYCNGTVRRVDFREYDLNGPPSMVTAFTDYPTAQQTVMVQNSTTVEGDYRLGPVGGLKPAGTFKWMEISQIWTAVWPMSWQGFEVSVIGTWGIGVVPEDVKEAALIAIDESFRNPERGATRVLGPMSYSEPIEAYETTGDAPWRALPASSRALLAEYRDDPTPILV